MEFIVDNWYIVVALVVLCAFAGYGVRQFSQKSTKEQIALIKEWLLWAVVQAEKELGSGTGALKLRKVYDEFVARFSWISQVISFEYFSVLVDEALDKMRDLIKDNKEVRAYVNTPNE